jgi:hypothetical protein
MTASLQWDKLVYFIKDITDPEEDNSLDDVFELISSSNTLLKDLLREYLLDSGAFKDVEVLRRVELSPSAVSLGIKADADLRARNLALQVCISDRL